MSTERKRYPLGTQVAVLAIFRDSDSELIDPTAVRFLFRDPAGGETEYVYGVDAELVRESEGRYRADIDANMSGNWQYRYYSTGEGQAAHEGSFAVDKSQF